MHSKHSIPQRRASARQWQIALVYYFHRPRRPVLSDLSARDALLCVSVLLFLRPLQEGLSWLFHDLGSLTEVQALDHLESIQDEWFERVGVGAEERSALFGGASAAAGSHVSACAFPPSATGSARRWLTRSSAEILQGRRLCLCVWCTAQTCRALRA
jgi:hypothetical protein